MNKDPLQDALEAVSRMLNIKEPPKDQHKSKAWTKSQYVTVNRMGIKAARRLEDKS